MGKNKRAKSYYINAAKRAKKGGLGPDMVGYLCTCNFYERDCVKEAYNVLNEFADTLYGKAIIGDAGAIGSKSENVDVNEEEEREKEENGKKTKDQEGSDSDEEPMDIEAAIKADVSVLKKSNEEKQNNVRRFKQVSSGAKNVVFIQTTLEDPLPVSLAIMDDILQSQKQRTKKLLRMIPVQATCKAYPEDIEKAVKKLSSTYFKETSNTFCVVFKVRNNTTIKKENMILDLVQIVENANSKNIPVLDLPEVVLNVDIVRNVCCLSLLPHYFTRYSKYNLVTLATKNKSLLNEDSSVKAEKEDNDVKAEKEDCVKAEKEDNDVKAEKEDCVKEEKEDNDVEAEKEDNDVKAEKEDNDVKAEQEDISVKADKEDISVKAEKEANDVKAEKEENDVKAEKEDNDVKGEKEENDVKAEKKENDVKAEKEDNDVKAEKEDISDKADKGTVESKDIIDKAEKSAMNSKENFDNNETGTLDSEENVDEAQKGILD